MKQWFRIVLCLVVAAGVQSCKKTVGDQTLAIIGSCASPPEPVLLVLLDKQGSNLITSAADQVTISYTDKGQVTTVPNRLVTLLDAASRQPTTKYSGLAVACGLGDYSVRSTNSIKSFQVRVNGRDVGTITYDLQPNTTSIPTSTGVRECFKLVAFQFNALPVQLDTAVMPFAGIIHCSL